MLMLLLLLLLLLLLQVSYCRNDKDCKASALGLLNKTASLLTSISISRMSKSH